MKIQIVAPEQKYFNIILKTINAQLTLWTQNPQFNCRPMVKGDDIKLIGYGKNADKDKWFFSFANGIVDYLKPKYIVEATISDDTMKFEFFIDAKETPTDADSTSGESHPRRKKRPKGGD